MIWRMATGYVDMWNLAWHMATGDAGRADPHMAYGDWRCRRADSRMSMDPPSRSVDPPSGTEACKTPLGCSELTTALALWNAMQCGDIRFRYPQPQIAVVPCACIPKLKEKLSSVLDPRTKHPEKCP